VRLPSGGAIVVDHTEALVSVDINSARATKGSDIEETALSTNLEAADEVARQLRIRDVGGLIVIDFIDMTPAKNQREVENRLRDALKQDRARVQVGRISRFGLLEMSRQRVRPSLGESSLRTCPTCNGRGNVRGPESLSLSVLRIVEEEAMKESTSKVLAKLPVEVATYLLNEKRESISEVEKRQGVAIILVPDPLLQSPNYEIHRVRDADTSHDVHQQPSYELTSETPDISEFTHEPASPHLDEPAVKKVAPPPAPAPRTAPSRKLPSGPGFFARLFSKIFADKTEAKPGVERGTERGAEQSQPRQRGQQSRRQRGRGRGGAPSGERRRRGGGGRNSASGEQKGDSQRPQQGRDGGGRGRGRGRGRSERQETRKDSPRNSGDARSQKQGAQKQQPRASGEAPRQKQELREENPQAAREAARPQKREASADTRPEKQEAPKDSRPDPATVGSRQQEPRKEEPRTPEEGQQRPARSIPPAPKFDDPQGVSEPSRESAVEAVTEPAREAPTVVRNAGARPSDSEPPRTDTDSSEAGGGTLPRYEYPPKRRQGPPAESDDRKAPEQATPTRAPLESKPLNDPPVEPQAEKRHAAPEVSTEPDVVKED
jgi:ribonuclease E